MDLNEYQKKARSTAIYTNIKDSQMLYPALGLIGECGEVSEKIKKLIRDDNGVMSKERASAVAKELGDCCWYLANICCDTDLSLSMMYEMRGASIIQKIRTFTLPQLVIYMNYYAVAVARNLEQWYYKYQCQLCRANQFIGIPNHISYIMACIEEIADRCGFTLKEIYVANINKLAGRKQRGTLHGDGDNR